MILTQNHLTNVGLQEEIVFSSNTKVFQSKYVPSFLASFKQVEGNVFRNSLSTFEFFTN